MKIGMYAIYDVKTMCFWSPMVFQNDGHAVREVSVAFERNEQLKRFPGDYDLYRVGSWDDGTGMVVAEVPVALVCKGTALAGDGGPRIEKMPPLGRGGGAAQRVGQVGADASQEA